MCLRLSAGLRVTSMERFRNTTADRSGNNGTIVAGQSHGGDKIIDFQKTNTNVPAAGGGPVGDLDRGISKLTNGPFINKADEGNIRFKADDDPAGGGSVPYFLGG